MTAADRIRAALAATDPGASGNALDITEADVVALLADRDRAQAEADHFAETGLAEQNRRVLVERRIARARAILDAPDATFIPGTTITNARAALDGEIR